MKTTSQNIIQDEKAKGYVPMKRQDKTPERQLNGGKLPEK